jgi:predicted lipid-binding transport protein (Tim44 family)
MPRPKQRARPSSRASKRAARPSSSRPRRPSGVFTLFERTNYLVMLGGIFAVILGYALMAIEGKFQGVISLYVAPIVILGGYVAVGASVLWRPDETERAPGTTREAGP